MTLTKCEFEHLPVVISPANRLNMVLSAAVSDACLTSKTCLKNASNLSSRLCEAVERWNCSKSDWIWKHRNNKYVEEQSDIVLQM